MLEVIFSVISFFELLASIRNWNRLTQLEKAQAVVGWISFLILILFVLFLMFGASLFEVFGSAGDWLAKKAGE